jgi:hypothetical protein
MSTVALESDIDTRWISANGTLVNLLFAAIFWLVLLRPQRYRPATSYFPAFSTLVTGRRDPGLRPALDVAAWARCAESSRRLRMLCWTPYFTDGILAGLGGLFNPLGLFYVIASALPSTSGANAGLLSLASMMQRWRRRSEAGQVRPIPRSATWIATTALANLLFIFVLGRGVTWSR